MERGQQNTLAYSEVEKIHKQLIANGKRDDQGQARKLGARRVREQGTTSQRCLYSVKAGFPGLCSMNFYNASLLISTQLQSLHSYQANNFLMSKISVCCWLSSREAKFKEWEFHWERKNKRKAPNQLKASIQSNPTPFCHFSSFQNPTFQTELKPSSNSSMFLHVDCKSYFRV